VIRLDTITISVPVPSPKLSPNSRGGWRSKIRPKQAAKGFAFVAAIGANASAWRGWTGPIVVDVSWYGDHPRVLKMDDDNAWARLKATRDAAAEAMGVNDHCFKQGDIKFAVDKADPRVVLTFTRTVEVKDGPRPCVACKAPTRCRSETTGGPRCGRCGGVDHVTDGLMRDGTVQDGVCVRCGGTVKRMAPERPVCIDCRQGEQA